MRIARKLALLAATAVTVLGLTAPSASAQLEFTNEADGVHCSAVTAIDHVVTGGCPIHMTSGNVTLRQHIFGVESTVSVCTIELRIRFDEDGFAYVYDQVFAGGGCTREACAEPGGTREPWPANAWEYSLLGLSEVLEPSICIATTDTMTESPVCLVGIPFRASPGNSHRYEFGFTDGTEMPGLGTGGFRCEVIGHWATEGTSSGMEVAHL